MTKSLKNITLRHLYINKTHCIGLEFKTDKVLDAMAKGIPNMNWNSEMEIYAMPNTRYSLDHIFNTFRGVAWVNTKYFFRDKPISKGRNEPIKIKSTVVKNENWKRCPKTYVQKLELKRYALSTAKSYINYFERFINHYNTQDINELNENDIRSFLELMVKQGASDSAINQAVNSIKFYYELVLGMPNRFYQIERPRKKLLYLK